MALKLTLDLCVCPGFGCGFLPHRVWPVAGAFPFLHMKAAHPMTNTKRNIVRPIKKIVAYYRLSEQEPGGAKGDAYSLEDQQREVAQFAVENDATIIGEFTEFASDTKDVAQRPELGKAIYMARLHCATLVVGRQDRLACNVYIICTLMES
jgi:hypothetical protein